MIYFIWLFSNDCFYIIVFMFGVIIAFRKNGWFYKISCSSFKNFKAFIYKADSLKNNGDAVHQLSEHIPHTDSNLISSHLIGLDDHNDRHCVKVAPIINIKWPVTSFNTECGTFEKEKIVYNFNSFFFLWILRKFKINETIVMWKLVC